jgi:hypothetical protein
MYRHMKVAHDVVKLRIARLKLHTTIPKLPVDDVKLFGVVKLPTATLK